MAGTSFTKISCSYIETYLTVALYRLGMRIITIYIFVIAASHLNILITCQAESRYFNTAGYLDGEMESISVT